jgi:hypothetical protein
VLNIATADGLTPTGSPIHAEELLLKGCESILVHNAFSKWRYLKCLSLMALRILYVTLKNKLKSIIVSISFETQNYNNQTAFDGYSRGRTTIDKSSGLPTEPIF